MKFVFGMLSAGALMAASWTGVISDAGCGAKHADPLNEACVKKCVEKGQAAVFVNSADGKVFKIANQDAVKEHLGHKVTINGKAKDDTITVKKVKM